MNEMAHHQLTEDERFQKIVAIQEMINRWLSDNGFQTLTERMAQNGRREILGQLTADHKLVLQQMLAQKFPDLQKRLKAANTSSNGRQILGVMSAAEWDLVDELLSEFFLEKEAEASIAAVEKNGMKSA